jgi:hypothetical protein
MFRLFTGLVALITIAALATCDRVNGQEKKGIAAVGTGASKLEFGRAAAAVGDRGSIRWKEIAWQPSVEAAVQESQESGKPLLLFVYAGSGFGNAGPKDKDDC